MLLLYVFRLRCSIVATPSSPSESYQLETTTDATASSVIQTNAVTDRLQAIERKVMDVTALWEAVGWGKGISILVPKSLPPPTPPKEPIRRLVQSQTLRQKNVF